MPPDESSTLDYTSAMQSMEQDLINNSDPFDIISYEYDIEDSSLNARRLCAAVINGEEIVISASDPRLNAC